MTHTYESLKQLTKFQLLDIATDLDVKYRTRMAKPKLIESILEIQDQGPMINNEKNNSSTENNDTVVDQAYEQDFEITEKKEKMEASKFQTLHEDDSESKYEEYQEHYYPVAGDLNDYHHTPEGYGDNHVVAMVIDPQKIYSYWEVTEDKINQIKSESNLGDRHYDAVIRVYDVTDIDFNGGNAWSMSETQVGFSRDWYLNVEPNRSYCVDLGLKAGNDFYLIARSNIVSTPPDTVSDFYDEEWLMIDFNKNTDLYNELYRLSGGHTHRYQLNSAFLTEQRDTNVNMTTVPSNFSSESLFSQMMQVKSKKDFWLWVDTELTVYGQTKSDASLLTINGEEIKIDSDGRFRLHMALPNGHFPFKVKAVSNDGTMAEEITPVVDRSILDNQPQFKAQAHESTSVL